MWVAWRKGGKKKWNWRLPPYHSFLIQFVMWMESVHRTYARITLYIQSAATIIGYEWKCEVCVCAMWYKNRYVCWDMPNWIKLLLKYRERERVIDRQARSSMKSSPLTFEKFIQENFVDNWKLSILDTNAHTAWSVKLSTLNYARDNVFRGERRHIFNHFLPHNFTNSKSPLSS